MASKQIMYAILLMEFKINIIHCCSYYYYYYSCSSYCSSLYIAASS